MIHATPVGFEPTRGDPIGLAGRRLSHSAKVSYASSCVRPCYPCLRSGAQEPARSRLLVRQHRERRCRGKRRRSCNTAERPKWLCSDFGLAWPIAVAPRSTCKETLPPSQKVLSIWTHWGLNPGPSACEADVIPLHHVPLMSLAASVRHGDDEKANAASRALEKGRAAHRPSIATPSFQVEGVSRLTNKDSSHAGKSDEPS